MSGGATIGGVSGVSLGTVQQGGSTSGAGVTGGVGGVESGIVQHGGSTSGGGTTGGVGVGASGMVQHGGSASGSGVGTIGGGGSGGSTGGGGGGGGVGTVQQGGSTSKAFTICGVAKPVANAVAIPTESTASTANTPVAIGFSFEGTRPFEELIDSIRCSGIVKSALPCRFHGVQKRGVVTRAQNERVTRSGS